MSYTWQELCSEYEDIKWEIEAEDEDNPPTAETLQRWTELQDLNKELNDKLDYGPNASVEWINEDQWIDHVKDMAQMFNWIATDSPVFHYINWDELGAQQFADEYDEITFEGEMYYFKDIS